MTNPDNVGGLPHVLSACPFCGSPAEIDVWERTALGAMYYVCCTNRIDCRCMTVRSYEVKTVVDAWNRRNGELCRAAPAWGDDWPFLEEMGRDGKPTGYWIRKGSPAAARMSAPAGSGEVEELVQKWLDESESGFDGDGNLSDTWTAQAKRACADELTALLRKLQQGAE